MHSKLAQHQQSNLLLRLKFRDNLTEKAGIFYKYATLSC